MGLSSPGIGSGLDVKGMVEACVKADIASIQARHDKKLNSANVEVSALGQFKSALASLQTTFATMSNLSQFYKLKSTLTDSTFYSAQVSDAAKPGTYQIQVLNLAQSQSLSSNAYANDLSNLGSGTITINFGTYNDTQTAFTLNPDCSSVTVNIGAGNDSLSAVCDAINAASSKVNAAIIHDASGARLSLTSTQTGEDFAMQIQSNIAGLNYDPTTGNATLNQTLAAKNSEVKINGLLLKQNSNHLDNILTGISLDLKQADATKTATLTIENNKEQLTANVREFVKKYNECMSALNAATGFDQETKKPGIFQGDSLVKRVKYDLYDTVVNFISADEQAELHTLRDLGIKSTKDCLLEIDEKIFTAAVENHFAEIGSLFAKSLEATDPNVQISGQDTQAKAGTYALVLDEYTPGSNLSGTLGGLPFTSKDGTNLSGSGRLNSINLKIMGGTTGDRGEIIVRDGLAVVLDDLLENYLGRNGDVSRRTDAVNLEIRGLDAQQQQIEQRAEVLTKKYYRQWNSVDLLISQLQGTSSMLQDALANLPKMKTNN